MGVGNGPRRKGIMKRIAIVIFAVFLIAGCSNWETTIYQALSGAKATIDCASAEYNHTDAQITQYCTGVTTPSTVYISQTATNHDILLKAQTAKDAAVNAMLAYESAKAAKNATDEATLQAQVDTLVAALTADVAEVTTIFKQAALDPIPAYDGTMNISGGYPPPSIQGVN